MLIGQAWMGKHVIIIKCQMDTNLVLQVHTSYHAPMEPIQKNCAETLSQHLSIGYRVIDVTYIPPNAVQYLLVLENQLSTSRNLFNLL
ncbi:hypothetical protein F4V44_11740 [Niallia endozanthoxylica]|uniref:Uncharacterized protein n=2 Tax=Niallia endozanthoxylica TaxID=2036016 RepID=A0A5J5HUG4_9BACI|nr:hypothetical protein F4V44_11740 [Niallia endozanthoxylica]